MIINEIKSFYEEHYSGSNFSRRHFPLHGKKFLPFSYQGIPFYWIGGYQTGQTFYLTFSIPEQQKDLSKLIKHFRSLVEAKGFDRPGMIGTIEYMNYNARLVRQYFNKYNIPAYKPNYNAENLLVFIYPYDYIHLLLPYYTQLSNAKQIRHEDISNPFF